MHTPPLAERMRPQKFEDFVGQEKILGPEGVLTNAIAKKILPSIILWGPPGCGKTTIATILSKQLDYRFFQLNAINAGVKDIREVIEASRRTHKALLFIDEIHRFNKSQQDALLNAVEKGIITLVGATTENPSFEVNHALLSRCQVYKLEELAATDLDLLLSRALETDKYLTEINLQVREKKALFHFAGGDARKMFNILEAAILFTEKDDQVITDDIVEKAIVSSAIHYDKAGDQHYDIISAFIKSIRGSDPDAAVYWLARMLEGGEDIKFIARRMIISASEDIGNANPTALVIANNCFQSVNVVGMPEARIILSQAAVYLASSAKSNASYNAINEAMQLVKQTGNLPVPLHLRNAPTKLQKDLGYGKGYKYSHNYANGFTDQQYLPDKIKDHQLYHPGHNPREKEMNDRLQKLKEQDK